MKISSIQILVSIHHFPIKGKPGLLEEVVASRARERKIQVEAGAFCGIRKLGVSQKRMGACQQDTRDHVKEIPMAKVRTT